VKGNSAIFTVYENLRFGLWTRYEYQESEMQQAHQFFAEELFVQGWLM